MWARVGEVTARLLLSPTLAYSCPTLLHHKHTALQHVCQLHLLFRTAVCYYLAIVSCVPAQHTVTIAPHVTMPHPTLAHAPISIQPRLFQDTHPILRTRVRFCLHQRLHDLVVASFCRKVQRCLLVLIYIYKYIKYIKYDIYNM